MPIFRRKAVRVPIEEESQSDDSVVDQKEPQPPGEPRSEAEVVVVSPEHRQKRPFLVSPTEAEVVVVSPEHRQKRPFLVSPTAPATPRRYFSPKAVSPELSVSVTRPFPCGHDKHCCSWYEHTIALLLDFCRVETRAFFPFILVFVLLVYTFVGAVIMWIMERHYTLYFWDTDYSQQDAVIEQLWHDRMTMSKDVWKASVSKVYLRWSRHHHDLDEFMGWSFLEAFFYSLGVCCASHTAHLEPRTVGGKVFTVVFALAGIPLYLIVAMEVGRIVARIFCVITRVFLASIRWLTSMTIGTYGRDKTPASFTKYQPVCQFNCKMAMCMAALYIIIGGGFVLGSAPHGSIIDFFYYNFVACSCIEIGDVFHHSSIAMPYLLFQIGGMAVFSIMFEVIQMELCDRIPCTTPQMCQRLKEQAWFWEEGSMLVTVQERPYERSYEQRPYPGFAVKPRSVSSSPEGSDRSSVSGKVSGHTLTSTDSEDRRLATARITMLGGRPVAATREPAPGPEPAPARPKKKLFPFRRHTSDSKLGRTRGSV